MTAPRLHARDSAVRDPSRRAGPPRCGATIAGVVATGRNTVGVPLDGRTYAFTITTEPDAQSFSLPEFDVSTTTCDGSDRRQVPVTSGRLRQSLSGPS